MTSTRNILELSGIEKTYGTQPALSNVSLTIGEGEVLALLGPNGAGKTTMVSIAAGLLRPDAGEVRVDGIDVVQDAQAAQHRIGLASQDVSLYAPLSVRENLQFFGRLSGLSGEPLTRSIAETTELFMVADMLDRPVRFLSGGEQRRVHTAAALLARPPLLLLDEPTAGVDVGTRSHIVAAVRALAREHGSAVCYSTHYLAEVEQLDASVAVLFRGSLLARGTVADLIATHGEQAVELAFEGEAPADIDGITAEVAGDIVRLRTNEPAATVATVLGRLRSGDVQRLRTVQIVTPSLDAAFLALTGVRYEASDSAAD